VEFDVAPGVKRSARFRVFLRWVKANKVASKAQLRRVLRAELERTQERLDARKKSREGTNSTVQRALAKQLDFLRWVDEKVVR